MTKEEALHYLKVLLACSSPFQFEIREAISFAIKELENPK
jgi:hypothetical protein